MKNLKYWNGRSHGIYLRNTDYDCKEFAKNIALENPDTYLVFEVMIKTVISIK